MVQSQCLRSWRSHNNKVIYLILHYRGILKVGLEVEICWIFLSYLLFALILHSPFFFSFSLTLKLEQETKTAATIPGCNNNVYWMEDGSTWLGLFVSRETGIVLHFLFNNATNCSLLMLLFLGFENGRKSLVGLRKITMWWDCRENSWSIDGWIRVERAFSLRIEFLIRKFRTIYYTCDCRFSLQTLILPLDCIHCFFSLFLGNEWT